MLASLKKLIKKQSHTENEKLHPSAFLKASVALIEEVLLWKSVGQSISFILFLHLIFFLCIYKQIGLLQFILHFITTVICLDALETWLILKHRTNLIKQIKSSSETNFFSMAYHVKFWLRKKAQEYLYLRERNHTKAFLLLSILLSMIFAISYCINGYFLIYVICMIICFLQKLTILVQKCMKKISVYAESDSELEDLVPENSEANLKELAFITEQIKSTAEIDVLPNSDSWNLKEDVLIDDDASDSSENSTSIETSISIEKVQVLDKNIETSDSSDDEYIPRESIQENKEKLKPTFEDVTSSDSWGTSAYNAFFNLTGIVSNMVYSMQTQNRNKGKFAPSMDSSDGFEMVDEHDLL